MIVNRLSRVMGDRRMNIQELHRRSGISYAALHDLYHARSHRFDESVLDRLCTALGCAVCDILEYQADPS